MVYLIISFIKWYLIYYQVWYIFTILVTELKYHEICYFSDGKYLTKPNYIFGYCYLLYTAHKFPLSFKISSFNLYKFISLKYAKFCAEGCNLLPEQTYWFHQTILQ